VTTHIIGGVEFVIVNTTMIMILKDRRFFEWGEAYDLGLLMMADLHVIFNTFIKYTREAVTKTLTRTSA